jgi:Uma2 family endonuclease
MTAVIDMPRSRPLTVADLADRPDDGHRYELLDGVLIVTPAPSMRHQDAALSLAVLLRAASPPALKVLTAPFDVTLADDTVLQPDVLVFDRKQVTARDLPGAPLLAVEVLSPSTRRFDLHLKRSRYEAAGTAAYWVVDPGEPPALTAWELRAGEYVEVASVSGPEEFAVQVPFAMTVVPDDLVDPDVPSWAR